MNNNNINIQNNFLSIEYMNTTFKFATGRKIKAFRKNNKINPLITKRIKESIENNLLLPENLSEFLKEQKKVFNRRTGRLVNKKTYFKLNNQLRKKFQNLKVYNDFIISTNEEETLRQNFTQFLQDTTEEEGDFIINKNSFINSKNIMKILKSEITNELILVKVGNQFYSMNDKTFLRLSNIIEGIVEINQAGSDVEIIQHLEQNNKIKLTRIHKTKKDAGFFPYLINYDLDLKKYGIFNKFDKDNYNENCFIRALRESNIVSKNIIDNIILSDFIKCRVIPKSKLNNLCDKFHINIDLWCGYKIKTKNGKEKNKMVTYPTKNRNKKNPTLKLGLIEKHYFLIDKTKYTNHFLENIDEYINKDPKYRHMKIEGKRIRIRKKQTMNSYKLIELLLTKKDKFFTSITYENKLLNTQFYDKFKDFKNLVECGENEFKEVIYKEIKEENSLKNVPIYFFDFETYAEKKTLNHIPYMVCFRKYQKYNKKEYSGKDEERKWENIEGECMNGINCGKDMLDSILSENPKQKKIVLYAHNLKYDWIFIKRIFGLRIQLRISPNGRTILVNCFYKGVKLIIKDTLCLIPSALREFNKMFNIDTEKEIMPYSIYNLKNITEKYIHKDLIKKCKEFVKKIKICGKKGLKYKYVFDEDLWKQFLENCHRWGCIGVKKESEGKTEKERELFKKSFNKVHIIKYSKIYCLLDCKVLNDGFDIFRGMIKEITDLDCIDILTISSIADKYLIKQGCYDGCYSISGVPREYIQKCVVGGRTMVRDNKPNLKLNCDIVDYDACSLYPSAMYRIKGYIKGLPKVIKNFNQIKNSATHYYVRVKITKINKKRHMSCISYLDKKGTRQFSNDMIGKVIYLDKTGLEDFVEFMKGEYQFIDGYYFNDGYNTKIKECIKHLYDSRLKFKNQLFVNNKEIKLKVEDILNLNEGENKKNNLKERIKYYNENNIKFKKVKSPIQGVIKLIMNSAYGKTMLKSFEDKEVIKSNKKLIKKDQVEYYEKNFKNQLFKEKGKYYINEGEIFLRNNYNSIKEAEIVDNTYFIKQYYVTGEHFNRVHLGVQILSMSKRIMNEVVYTGEDNDIDLYYMDTDSLHLDRNKVKLLEDKFEEKYKRKLRGSYMGNFHTDLEMKGIDGSKIRSINSIFLTKKVYINQLEGIDENGKKHYDFHIRLKGVPTKSVYHYGQYHNIQNPIEIYKKIYNGEKLEFDLSCGGTNTLFEFDKDKNVKFKLDFTRKVKLHN